MEKLLYLLMVIEVLDKMLSLSNYMAINMQISRNKLKLSY